jgi:acetyl esterase/lipase
MHTHTFPGVSAIFPGPYLGWHPIIPSESELTAARELVLDVLNEEGPFDGLMGFSQGAALAASLVLQHSDQGYPLVDCAVFICGTLPWMLRSELVPLHQKHNANCQISVGLDLDNGMQRLLALIEGSVSGECVKNKLSNGHQDGYHAQQSQVGLLHPANSPLRFPIPTAHIYGGRKDRYFEQSKALIELGSDAHGVKVFDHEAGHIVPRGEFDTGKMVETVSWVAEKVIWRC